MTDLNELYQAIILDHNRRPRNFGELPNPDATASGKNPLCGDEVSLWLKYGPDDTISEITFRGVGCAISRASASMMTAAVKGATREHADDLFREFQGVVTGQIDPKGATLLDKNAAIFSGVSRYPVRVKCATLPWHALKRALHGNGDEGSKADEGTDSGAQTPTER